MKKQSTPKKVAKRIVKLKVKSIKPHSNFAEEIQSLEKADKFFDKILIAGYIILAILAITYIILK